MSRISKIHGDIGFILETDTVKEVEINVHNQQELFPSQFGDS